jgi:hypothetical protein
MPWGKHKGAQLKDIPADYFLWLMEQSWLGDWPQLKSYITRNADAFYKEQQENAEEGPDRDYSSYQDFLDNR